MNRVAYLRKTSGISVRDFSRYVGLSRTVLSDIERGEALLHEGTIELLMRFFGCTSDYLLGLSDWGILIYRRGDMTPTMVSQAEFESGIYSTKVIYTGVKVEIQGNGRTPLVCSHAVYREQV